MCRTRTGCRLAVSRCRRDAEADLDVGQAVGLVLIAIVFVASAAVAMISVGKHLTQRGSAQTAADAAALAGVDGGQAAAAEVAGRNDAVLLSFERRAGGDGYVVIVAVSVGDEQAVAQASSEP
jgi:hypothetical protein